MTHTPCAYESTTLAPASCSDLLPHRTSAPCRPHDPPASCARHATAQQPPSAPTAIAPSTSSVSELCPDHQEPPPLMCSTCASLLPQHRQHEKESCPFQEAVHSMFG